MGKICYINGQPFMVSLPIGGKYKGDKPNQWDELINFLGEDCDDSFHWKSMFSWCQERVSVPLRTLRGYGSARFWRSNSSDSRFNNFGFRPILTPLASDTLLPDPSLLDDIPDGRVFAPASLYMDGKVIQNPKNPIDIGDIPDYSPEAVVSIGDRDANRDNWLWVIKYKDLLWCDRNILKKISWEDLKQQGFAH